MKYFEIVEKYNNVQQLIKRLEEEYKDKIKGKAYQKRKIQLIESLDFLKKQALQIGTKGTICHIHGKRSRPSLKNPSILVQENFNLYFTNISDQEALALVKLHVKNLVSYKMTFYRPGVIITSS